jgi:hypothetical protein
MTRVYLGNIECFRNREVLGVLTRMVVTNTTLKPYQIAQGTGCDLGAALEVLVLLYHHALAEGFLEVYHGKHPDAPPIKVVSFEKGPPSPPFLCEICEEMVESSRELYYDVSFRLMGDIELVVENQGVDCR